MTVVLLSIIAPLKNSCSDRSTVHPEARHIHSPLGRLFLRRFTTLLLSLITQPEKGGKGEQKGQGQQQERVGERSGVERVHGVQGLCSALPARRQESADDRRAGAATQEEDTLKYPKSH